MSEQLDLLIRKLTAVQTYMRQLANYLYSRMWRSNPGCEGPCNSRDKLDLLDRARRFLFDEEANKYGIRWAAVPDMPGDTIAFNAWVDEVTNQFAWHFRDHLHILDPDRQGIYPACMEWMSHSYAPLGWAFKCSKMGLLPCGTVSYHICARPIKHLNDTPDEPPVEIPLKRGNITLYKD